MENLHRFRDYTTRRGTSMQLSFCLLRHNWFEMGDVLLFAEDLGLPVSIHTVLEPDHGVQRLPTDELEGGRPVARGVPHDAHRTTLHEPRCLEPRAGPTPVGARRPRRREERDWVGEPPGPDNVAHVAASMLSLASPETTRSVERFRARRRARSVTAELAAWSDHGVTGSVTADPTGRIVRSDLRQLPVLGVLDPADSWESAHGAVLDPAGRNSGRCGFPRSSGRVSAPSTCCSSGPSTGTGPGWSSAPSPSATGGASRLALSGHEPRRRRPSAAPMLVLPHGPGPSGAERTPSSAVGSGSMKIEAEAEWEVCVPDSPPFDTACRAPWVSLEFDPAGLVYGCCASQLWPLGRIGVDRLSSIWGGPRAHVIREALRNWDFWRAAAPADGISSTVGWIRSLPSTTGIRSKRSACRGQHMMLFALSNRCNLAA